MLTSNWFVCRRSLVECTRLGMVVAHVCEVRATSRRHAMEYNSRVDCDGDEGSLAHLAGWLGKVGQRCTITPPFRCDYGVNIELGEDFYANFDCVFLDCGKIRFGRHCFLGPGVHVYTVTHPVEAAGRRKGTEWTRGVTVGDDVWIGGRAVVLCGVRIGDGAVIGAGAVVTRDVAAYTLVAGSPARVVRRLLAPGAAVTVAGTGRDEVSAAAAAAGVEADRRRALAEAGGGL
jgi:maltose O-acetyltransferase